mmetsp:Transcript_23375/g.46536  ORF Transcript_23375/g.46536 Transcript_23375/m.46536 type:complete len:653 (-) Transcript_23375:27-1985(-)
MKFASAAILSATLALGVSAECPYLASLGADESAARMLKGNPHDEGSAERVRQVADFKEVQKDLRALFTSNNSKWPADYDHYGPFFIRLAWHCSGSYRTSDGRGGCDGGRQRFDPERSWDDNTNLDKARSLLSPIKEKYGASLSYGDLFVLAGTTAIEDMGGPVLGFCGGRMDDDDGSASFPLGPTLEQEILAPCETNGDCHEPLGTTTIGLIYVNPEGPMGSPDPVGSAPQVRDTFARMAMNDTETVALIGGGHAFGKTHGACPDGPGLPPNEDEENPWSGECGTGVGTDAFTSGFEGPWTSHPTRFDNDYFKYLLEFDWESWVGPGGHNQWRVSESSNATSPSAPSADGADSQDVMMLTSDISLTRDPEYRKLVETFASDLDFFSEQFSHAWYKLTSRDMGPAARCMGSLVPPPEPFQYPLPSTPEPSSLVNFGEVRSSILSLTASDSDLASAFVNLAYSCASTFRSTDYLGGCNGARIRFHLSSFPGAERALEALEPIKAQFGDALSYADLIVMAGNVGVGQVTGEAVEFCGGRTDASASDPDGWEYLVGATVSTPGYDTSSGLSQAEYVALEGLVNGASTAGILSSSYLRTSAASKAHHLSEPDLARHAYSYVVDATLFKEESVKAWELLMGADRFDIEGRKSEYCSKF